MENIDSGTSFIELNVGGTYYSTLLSTLLSEANSFFHDLFENNSHEIIRDSNNRVFIDRDGSCFKLVLEYLRNKNLTFIDASLDRNKIKEEAIFFKLSNMVKLIDGLETKTGYITLAFRGKFHNMDHHHSHNSDFNDLKFRKISRISISGKVSICRDVFGDDLNESRDPDNQNEKYSNRYFLKHFHLEKAYDTLTKHNFVLASACAFGNQDEKESKESSEDKWLHYTELIFHKK